LPASEIPEKQKMVDGLLNDGSRGLLDAEKRGGKIFVGNVRKDVEKDEIHDVFAQYGKVLSIWVAKQPPGFAFVTYDEPESAKEAIQNLHESSQTFAESNGRGLRVEASTYAERKFQSGSGGSRQFRREDSRRRRARRDSRGRGRDWDDRDRYDRRDDRGRGRRDSRDRGGGRYRSSRRYDSRGRGRR